MAKLGTVVLVGSSGKQYEFDAYLREDAFKPLAAVYGLSKRIPIAEGEAEYSWVYFGETEDLSTRPLSSEHKACIDANDANCLCLYLEENARKRAAIVADLTRAYQPPCNR